MLGSELIKSLLDSIPSLPGIYQMLGANGKILYVGKAKDLKKRLTYYSKPVVEPKTIRMLEATCDLKYIVTSSEVEALILEAQLIKKNQPRFNVLLKDDKSFPFLKLRLDHDYPQLIKYRGTRLVGGKFFGPFTSNQQLDVTLTELQKIFKLRSCSDAYFATRKRPCLQYQIKRCYGPCVGKISKTEYAGLVEQVIAFLTGKTQYLQEELALKMQQYSEDMKFEMAAEIRDRIKALSYVQLKSGVVESGIVDVDIVAIVELRGNYAIQVGLYRGGQACGSKTYFPAHTENTNVTEVLSSFINQFYCKHAPAREVILNHEIPQQDEVAKLISKLHNIKFTFTKAKNEARTELIQNAIYNAKNSLEQDLKNSVKHYEMLSEIQKLFNLSVIPERIEIYDNSHIMGEYAVGAMVVATLSGFDRKEYRIFNIKNETKGDDYQMLREVLTRRFERIKKDNSVSPDLIIIDGGKGHLSITAEVMAKFGLNIKFVSMSKGEDRDAGLEQFHIINQQSFTLDKNSSLMKYLQILRDEAHNFAIETHRAKRSRSMTKSKLENIPNIGKVRKQALLHYFGSYKSIREASISELTKVHGISSKLAKKMLIDMGQDV